MKELKCGGPHYGPLLGALLIYVSLIRFRHALRSVLVKLTTTMVMGACTRGRGRPGFRWSMPRFGPLDTDVGGKLWGSWKQRHDEEVGRQWTPL